MLQKRFDPIDILSTISTDQHILLMDGDSQSQVQYTAHGPSTLVEIVIKKRKVYRRTFRFWLTKEAATKLRDNLNLLLEDSQ